MTHRVHRGSVLPKIGVTRSRGTTILGARLVTSLELVSIVFLLIAALVGLYFAMHESLDAADRIRSGTSSITALGFALALWRDYRRRAPLQWGSLRLRTWPLRLGQEVRVELRGSLTGAPVTQVAATFECGETVQVGRGKGQTTRTASRYAIELVPPDTDLAGTHVTARWTFTIPADQPPSFAVESNTVRWRLLIRITKSDGTEVPADFDLLVLPEVVA